MARFDTEQDLLGYFEARFANSTSPLLLDIEEESIGTRVGASSWSTPEQVVWMAEASELSEGDLFLDIGSGAGWPGLRIASLTGASGVLTDVPASGLETARDVVAGSGLDVTFSRADATRLPFSSGCFDAITHSDVLCCLAGKREVLEDCRRVLRPDGVMVFGVILIGEDVPDEEAREQGEFGPEFAYSESPYGVMLAEAGFAFEVEDLTSSFHELAIRTERARSSREAALTDQLGEEEAAHMIGRSRWNVNAIEAGFLKRRSYVARPSS